MVPRSAVILGALVACQHGEPPDLIGLDDQIAVVGQQFTLELSGVDPDGDSLSFSVHADIALDAGATVTKLPSGTGLFRWTPLAADVGAHVFDFTVSDGSNDTTVSIAIDVRATSGGTPVFREPLGAGRVINLANDPCITVDIVVEDQDTAELAIGERDPKISGAVFTQLDGTSASWMWCPTPDQVAASDRYTLVLSADDADSPTTIKNYVIVLAGNVGPGIVINEIDYDNVGTDNAEYIELFNPSATATSLAGVSLVLINGTTSDAYETIDLSPIGSLAAGQFLVVANSSVTVPSSAIKLDPLWTQDEIQNGAPDGIALVDDVSHVVIDALSYEGSITAATIPGIGAPVSLVEGTALPGSVADSNTVSGTLCRDPAKPDANSAATDWTFCATRTVGTKNTP